jgi:DNA polymerase-3 subunit delta'
MTASEDIELGSKRPRRESSLLGHEGAERLFLDAFRRGRLAHAWLIAGPRGIGKATLAFRIARFLLARASVSASADSLDVGPEHPVFARIAAFAHADLFTLEPGFDENRRLRGEIVIDDVRKLIGFFALTAAESGYRIAVVDAADQLNRNAANALLKLLEEPPPQSLLLLVAHQPGLLLPTIRSRCRRLKLSPLPEAITEQIIARHLPEMPVDERTLLAKLSEGSPGRALELAALGGLELHREMLAILADLPDLDHDRVHAFSDRFSRGDAHVFYDGFIRWLERTIKAAADAEDIAQHPSPLVRIMTRRKLPRWVETWENLNRLFLRADRLALDRKAVILSAFLSLERTSHS